METPRKKWEMQSKLKQKDKKLTVYPATGVVTVTQGRNPVGLLFVFLQHLAVCLAHTHGPFIGRRKFFSVYTQPTVV